MQGVIGRMQADVDSLNQRAAASLRRRCGSRPGDLQLRVSRMGRLVDDVEAQLY